MPPRDLHGPFPETHWSQLVALQESNGPRRRELLARLAELYWSPIYHYVRSVRRVSPQDAQDHTQQFFAHLLEPGRLERMAPQRGSFRGFLKTAVRNFLTDADRTARARSRSFLHASAEAAWQERPELSPEEAFDRAWGRAVLTEAVERLRAELRAGNRERQLTVFEGFLLDGNLSYRERAVHHGISEDDVRNRLRETRQRLRQIARDLLREYLDPTEEVEKELALLLAT